MDRNRDEMEGGEEEDEEREKRMRRLYSRLRLIQAKRLSSSSSSSLLPRLGFPGSPFCAAPSPHTQISRSVWERSKSRQDGGGGTRREEKEEEGFTNKKSFSRRCRIEPGT